MFMILTGTVVSGPVSPQPLLINVQPALRKPECSAVPNRKPHTMLNPSTRQIYLPNYKLNITVPTAYSDAQVADTIWRNRVQIQHASPVFAQGQQTIQNALGPQKTEDGLQIPALGITEAQARAQGIGPAVRAAQDASQYNPADQLALLRHYSAQKAINSANQHPNAAQILQLAQPNLLPTERLAAIGDRATMAMSNVVNTPLLNYALDYGAPGASQQLDQMTGYRAGLARGILGFSSPQSLATMAMLGSVSAEPMGANMLLGAFGAPALAGAYQRSQSGDPGGALGELTAFGLPFALHGVEFAQDAKNATDYRAGGKWMDDNLGVDADPAPQPLLPPGLDLNVYEADFQRNRPQIPSSTDPTQPFTSRPPYTPYTASALLTDGTAVDPASNMVQQTIGPTVSKSYGQETIYLPTEPRQYSDLPDDYDALEPGKQANVVASYHSDIRPQRNVAMPSPSVKDSVNPDVDDPTFSSAPLSEVLPLAPTKVSLTITSGEIKALSELLGNQHPFSTAMDQVFEGVTKADVPMTLPQLAALRNLAEQTTSVVGSGPVSYSRSALIKRINVAVRNFPNVSESANILPLTGQGGTDNVQQSISNTTRATPTANQSGSLNPTERKPADGSVRLLQQSGGSALTPVDVGTGGLGGVGGHRAGSISDSRNIENGQDIGLHPRPKQIYPDGSEINTENINAIPASRPSVKQALVERRKIIESVTEFGGGDEKQASLPSPRYDIRTTPAQGQLSRRWYKRYLKQVLMEQPHDYVRLQSIFQGETLERAKSYFEEYPQVLQSLVVLNEYMPNNLHGTISEDPTGKSGWAIDINGRLLYDPEELLSLIAEEAVHVMQKLSNQPFDFTLPYDERPHEIEAKKGALAITGQPYGRYMHAIVRTPGKPPSSELLDYARELLLTL